MTDAICDSCLRELKCIIRKGHLGRHQDRFDISSIAWTDDDAALRPQESVRPAPDALRDAIAKALPCDCPVDNPHYAECPIRFRARVLAAIEPVIQREIEKAEDAQPWRKLLWLNHGEYYKGLHSAYGDDGEMQCCGIDFKRVSVEFLEEMLNARALRGSDD